jgi:2-keto-3-deoxy-L-rhamnonate aldolase RhmA
MSEAIGENHAKRKLAADELVLCMGVNQMRTPNIAMIAAACGLDAIYIDLEYDPTSLAAAAASEAVDGIDMLPIGSPDLSTEMGIPCQYNHVRMRQAYDVTAAAARAHRKWMGVGGVREDLEFQTWLAQLGMRYLTVGSDAGYILSAGRADVRRLREVRLS